MDGSEALLIIGFESAELSQRATMAQAVEIARANGGMIDDDDIQIDDGTGAPTGRGGAVGAWRDAFIPRGGGLRPGSAWSAAPSRPRSRGTAGRSSTRTSASAR